MRFLVVTALLLISLNFVHSDTACSVVGRWSSDDVMQPGASNTAVFFSNESFVFSLSMMNCTFQLSGQYRIDTESDTEISISLNSQPIACNVMTPSTPVCSVIYIYILKLLPQQCHSLIKELVHRIFRLPDYCQSTQHSDSS